MNALSSLSLHTRVIPPEQLATSASASTSATAGGKPTDPKARARATAVDFEAQFLNTMFNEMFTDMDGDGPFGGGPAVGVWRSFLSDQYAKTFAKAGGVGIADQVYRTLIAHQEAQPQAQVQAAH
jgi:Rod binding domain-containing protein